MDPAPHRHGRATLPHGADSPPFPEARLARDQGGPPLLDPVPGFCARRFGDPQAPLIFSSTPSPNMSQQTSDSRPAVLSAPRPTFAPTTVVFVAIWACVFAAFI